MREDGTLHHTPGGPQGDKRQGGKESSTVMALMGTGSCLLPLSVFQSSAAAHFSPSQQQKHAARAHLLRTIKAWPSSLLPHRSSALASSTASPSWKMALIDPVVEEAIHNVHRALQRHNAEEESQEPGERDGRQR